MNNSFIQFVKFIALVATQVLVMNKVQFIGFYNPYIYILFIVLLPVRTPQWAMVILGFVLGLTVDVFTGVIGLHASATLLISFFRNRLLKFILGLKEDDFVNIPGIRELGTFKFVNYCIVIVFIHHLALFYLEVFTFTNAWDTLLRTFVNTMISMVFIVVAMILFEKKKYEQR